MTKVCSGGRDYLSSHQSKPVFSLCSKCAWPHPKVKMLQGY